MFSTTTALLKLEDICPKCVCAVPTGDMYTSEDAGGEPDWVQTEKKHFSEFRDANKVKAAVSFGSEASVPCPHPVLR